MSYLRRANLGGLRVLARELRIHADVIRKGSIQELFGGLAILPVQAMSSLSLLLIVPRSRT